MNHSDIQNCTWLHLNQKVKNCRGQQEKAPPESNLNEPKAISVDELQKGIEIKKPYVISLPADPKGVFTVSKSSGSGIGYACCTK